MREILFRGKEKYTGKWHYGNIINIWSYPRHVGNIYEIDQHTVGQYTGLKDKNGERVFDGDILKFDWINEEHYLGKVVWNSECACFDIEPRIENIDAFFRFVACNELEVIGNIHDNPELLKTEEYE